MIFPFFVNFKMKYLFLILPFIGFSQKIFTTDYPSQSDIKVFVVDYESQSDLKVFKVDYQSQSTENKGLWYFVKYPSQSDKKIYFVKYEFQADMITIVGHKFYGPRIGALFCKNPQNIIRPMFFGGNQERGYR